MKLKIITLLLIFNVCMLLVCVPMSWAQTIRYVKANSTGANNGSSWSDAYISLQSALAAAQSTDQIWVAAGTYKPTTGTDRTVSFVMKNGVAIYGGFNGTETQLSQRNWNTNATILSGEIGAAGIADNSNRVINNNFNSSAPLTSSAILDGFTVEAANANGTFPLNLGGGMWNTYASPTVRNCIFRNNTALAGAGMFNDNSQAAISNCLFVGNACSSSGAGIANGGGCDLVKIINCTFYGNTGFNTINNQSNAAFANCIIWGNGGSGVGGHVTYSIVQGGYAGTGNLNIDPLFANPANGDFRLQQCSPAIDAGTATDAPATDFVGNARVDAIVGAGVVDMGAYEYQSTYDFCTLCANINGGVIYVNASASGSNNGNSWANAFTDLQSALSLARTYPLCVSQIWVAKGTYRPTSGTDRKISFSMVEGVAIYGGFNGTESQLSERNWTLYQTILSGDIGTLGDNSDNSYRVVNNTDNGLTSRALLDGVTITAGYATNTNGYYEGAGMLNQNSSPSLKNINFVDNQAILGGGMYNIYSSPSLTNVTFSGNSATSSGGGMYVFGSNSVLTNVAFVNNQAPDGGGININLASPTLTNVVFLGNRASRGGGVFLANNSRPVLTNMTFSGNQATNGGSICNFESSPVLKNCILWGNGGEIANFRITNPTYTYCLIQGMNPAGMGNLDGTLPSNDPLFVSQPPTGLGTVGDLRLQSCSPVLNVGNDADNTLAMDIVGNNRKVGVIDFGAYEYQGSAVTKPTASASTSTADVCVGNRINLSAGGGGVFSWTGPNNFSSTDQNPNFIGSSVSYSGTYTVRVSNDNCASTATATVSVQVRANPTAIATSNSPVCKEGVMRLSVTGGAFYNWAGPNGYTSAQQNPTRSDADITMSGVYSVTLSSGSCTATASTVVQVRTLPLITASSNTPLCAGSTLNLSASGGTTYTWSGPGGYNSQQRNPTRSNSTTAMSGGYSIVGSDGTCANTTSTFVLVNPNVVPSITSLRVNGQLPNARGVVTVPTGQAINFSITASNAITYSWQSSTGFSSTLQNPSISNATMANQGQYIVVARNNCQFFAARSVSIRIGSASTRLASAEDTEGIEMEINAYPNPVSKTLRVEVRLKEAQPLQLKLLNSAGQTSGTWQLSEPSTVHRTELDLSQLMGGLYLLEAQAGQQRAVKRVVKVE